MGWSYATAPDMMGSSIDPRAVENPETSTFRPVSWMRRQQSPRTVLLAWVSSSIEDSDKCGDWAVNLAMLILTVQTAAMALQLMNDPPGSDKRGVEDQLLPAPPLPLALRGTAPWRVNAEWLRWSSSESDSDSMTSSSSFAEDFAAAFMAAS